MFNLQSEVYIFVNWSCATAPEPWKIKSPPNIETGGREPIVKNKYVTAKSNHQYSRPESWSEKYWSGF